MSTPETRITNTQRQALEAAAQGPLLQKGPGFIRPQVGRWTRPTIDRLVWLGLLRHSRTTKGLTCMVLTPYGRAVVGGEPFTGRQDLPPPAASVNLADRIAP